MNNELAHYGVPGMRWGYRKEQKSIADAMIKKIRQEQGDKIAKYKIKKTQKNRVERIRNKYDSKYEEAKKKLDIDYKKNKKEEKKLKKEEKKLKKEEKKIRKKSIKYSRGISNKKSLSQMTDEEIINALNRNKLEAEYLKVFPPKIPARKRFMGMMVNDILKPTAIDVGKKYADKFMKEVLGLNEKDSKETYESIKKEHDYLKMVNDRNTQKDKLNEYMKKHSDKKE